MLTRTPRVGKPRLRGMGCWSRLLILLLLGIALYILLSNIAPYQVDEETFGQERPQNLWQQIPQWIIHSIRVLVSQTLPALALKVRQAVFKIFGQCLVLPGFSMGMVIYGWFRRRMIKNSLVK